MSWDPHERLLTIDEAAHSIDRPASTIRRWLAEGRLAPKARQGRRWLLLEADVLEVDADTNAKRAGTVTAGCDNRTPARAGHSPGE